MAGGSQATRTVADLVLLDDSFEVLQLAFREGQRIVRGTQDLIKLFVARSLSLMIAILGVAVVGGGFPVTPKHNAIRAFLVVGIPTLVLAAWADPGKTPRGLLRSVIPFALPAALSIGAVEATLYISYLRATGDVVLARTVLTVVATLCGLALILFLQHPSVSESDAQSARRDWKPSLLVATMLALLIILTVVPGFRSYFELARLDSVDALIIISVVAAWIVALHVAWRVRLLERFLGLGTTPAGP